MCGAFVFVVQEDSVPVRYIDWAEWREIRTADDVMQAATCATVGGCFCASCWGAGRILEESPNGEGLIPVMCAWCAGRGTMPAA